MFEDELNRIASQSQIKERGSGRLFWGLSMMFENDANYLPNPRARAKGDRRNRAVDIECPKEKKAA
jgi:hypothetical protein